MKVRGTAWRLLLVVGLSACGADDPRPGVGTFATSSAGSTAGDSTTAAPDEGDTTAGDAESSDDAAPADSESGDGTGSPAPPFECDAQAADSPVLAGQVLFEPADPHPGDTLTVIVRATNGLGRPDAPAMTLQATSATGLGTFASSTIEGGEAVYYYAIPDVPAGDVCLLGLIDGATEVSAKVTVTDRPPGPPVDGGIYKITANHMWTCDEQPSNGNELHVWVRDEAGNPIEGAEVRLSLADSTDPGSIYNGDGRPLPDTLTTGADGHANTFNFWPISDHGLLIFEVGMANAASDIATEITTGWWEDDLMGCNYCNTPTVNVWGHWSYTVEFQRDPNAKEACVVPNDHAGMSACGEPRHVHHDPNASWCWAP